MRVFVLQSQFCCFLYVICVETPQFGLLGKGFKYIMILTFFTSDRNRSVLLVLVATSFLLMTSSWRITPTSKYGKTKFCTNSHGPTKFTCCSNYNLMYEKDCISMHRKAKMNFGLDYRMLISTSYHCFYSWKSKGLK